MMKLKPVKFEIDLTGEDGGEESCPKTFIGPVMPQWKARASKKRRPEAKLYRECSKETKAISQ